jgi:pyocin large subunit-like protein
MKRVNRMMRELKERRRHMLKNLKNMEVEERKQEAKDKQDMEVLLASQKLSERKKEMENMRMQLEVRLDLKHLRQTFADQFLTFVPLQPIFFLEI